MALWPLLIVKDNDLLLDAVFINHERIHLRQQVELLVLPFYIFYLTEFLLRWIYLKNAEAAYYSISFEREAYIHEKDLNYLKNRRFWSFIGYFRQ